MTTHRSVSRDAVPAPPHSGRSHHRWFFIAAAAVFVGALVGAAVWSISGVLAAWNAPDDFARGQLPGTVSASVTDTGTQYLYLEHADGTAVPPLDELGVTVTGPNGQEVAVKSTDLTVEYDAKGGDLGTAFATFEGADPGTYVVASTADEPGASLAVGQSVADPLLVPLAGSAVLLFLGASAAITLVVVGQRRRKATS